MSKKILFIATLLFSFILAPSVFAEHHSMKLPQLDLTKEQQAKITSIREEAKGELKPLFGKLKDLHLEMDKLVRSDDKMDESKVAELVKEQSTLRQEVSMIVVKMRHEIYGLLTADQKKKYNEMA